MSTILSRIDFGNEAAEDDKPDKLVTYFVEHPEFIEFIEPRNNLMIAHARKGVGKSALLQWIHYKVSQADKDALIIKCRGADLVRSRFNLNAPLSKPNDYVYDWMIRICAIVNRYLATCFKFALTDDQITLVEAAELNGFKERNFVGCLLERFQNYLDKVAVAPAKMPVKDEIEVMKRVKNRRVWILVDDLDATFQNTPEESIALSSFFSACRYLLQDVRDLNIRVTLRTDVWPFIRRHDEALDKVDQYVREILWHQKDFLQLLFLRIKASVQSSVSSIPSILPTTINMASTQDRLLQTVFVPKMEWTGKGMVDTYKVIYTVSYERPRWAIQLCKLAKEAAIRNQSELISKDHIDEVWGEYGTKRIADLVAEHKHQCPQVEELLNSFRGANRLMMRDELFAWINNRVSEHMEPIIEGCGTRSPMDIAHFLYRIGFIVARSEGKDENYEHYRVDQMPDFLTSRTNEDFSVKWEIHPCYREALDIKKIDKSHRQRFIQNRGG